MKYTLKHDTPRSQWEELIDCRIFHERNRRIVKRKYLDGVTFETLAEEFDMSVRHVKHICYKAMEVILKHHKA